jgi:two-component system KDP operon response regulator KdpE
MRQLTAVLAVTDAAVVRLLRANLRAGGYQVTTVHTSDEVKELISQESSDLLILDEQLHDSSGLELCRYLRENSNVPIVMIGSAERSAGVVAALDTGADDFLSYPYSMDEFFARVNAVMRRASREMIRMDEGKKRIGGLVIDLSQRQVTNQGVSYSLTPTEFKLLMYLANHPEQVITHEELLVHVWGQEYAHCVHYLRVGIGRLRHKIEKDPANPTYLVTCSGVGYMLQDNNRHVSCT